jgi:hypothetical protein
MNTAKLDEQSAIADSLGEMQRSSVTVYKHAGVELARVPGAEKLRVRLSKDDGDADVSDLKTADEAEDEAADDGAALETAGAQ